MRVLLKALAVFAGMTLLDIAFALYVIAASQRDVLAASYWAAAIQVCNVFVVASFVRDNRMAIPSVMGAFVGTWIAATYF